MEKWGDDSGWRDGQRVRMSCWCYVAGCESPWVEADEGCKACTDDVSSDE